jgi:hypothetical protein
MLFGLLLNSGLRISEALALKAIVFGIAIAINFGI